MNDIKLLERLNIPPIHVIGKITAKTKEEFINQFRRVFSTREAKESRGVVYIWSTSSGIPRMRGKSNVVYIGKTKVSLFERYHRYAKVEGSGINWEKYEFIIEKFGPIRVRFVIHENPREAEKSLLRCYLEEHLEFPPA